VLKLRNELCSIGRYSIETYTNIGGSLFPFQRVSGAYIQKGAVNTWASTVYETAIALVGGGRNEPLAVWLCVNGQASKVSTREIDLVLNSLTTAELQAIRVESRLDKSHSFLYVHLPTQTLVFDSSASKTANDYVWFTVDSGSFEKAQYRARNFTWVYNKWVCGDPTSSSIGYLVSNVSSHYGSKVCWEFATQMLYNQGKGAVVYEIELTVLSGLIQFADNPIVWTSYSSDGMTWSQERPKSCGAFGQSNYRLNWLQCGVLKTRRVQKFRGTSDAFITVASLEINLEPLTV